MSQTSEILKHMKSKPITPIEALNNYGCFRLAARINELRMDGHDIYTDIIENKGKRYAQYRLKSK